MGRLRNDEHEQIVSDQLTRESIWRTQAGIKVAVKDMSDQHLLNTIRVLRGLSPIGTRIRVAAVGRREWINAMANEAYRRGLSLDALSKTDPVHE